MATFTAVTVALDLKEMVQVLVTVLSPVLVGSTVIFVFACLHGRIWQVHKRRIRNG